MRSLGFQDSRTTQAIIATIRHVVALYATSWTTLENWSEYFLKNLRTKKLQEGIFQAWFAFDRKVPIEVVYQVSDSVTRITICPEYPAILSTQQYRDTNSPSPIGDDCMHGKQIGSNQSPNNNALPPSCGRVERSEGRAALRGNCTTQYNLPGPWPPLKGGGCVCSIRINSTQAKRRENNRIQPQCNGLQWKECWMLADRKRLKTLW